MEYYEVRHRLYDPVNRLQFQRGEIIQTDQDLWAARLGKSLKKIPNVSKNTTIKIVEKTKEGSSKVEVVETVEVIQEQVPVVRRRGILDSLQDKMVSADDSDVK
jgi:hypothetical protein